MKHLVTGINGFAGSHLADLLLSEGETVAGVLRSGSGRENIAHIETRLELREADVRDAAAMERIVRDLRPDRVYHLAAMTFVPQAMSDPAAAWATNVEGTRVVLESVARACPRARVLWAGSSEEYGRVRAEDLPVKETQALHPATVYGEGKAAAERAVMELSASGAVQVLVARAFNHTGPRQSARFLCPAFARQVAEIEAGAEAVMRVGNLDGYRDFSDVRDVVRAYRLLAERGKAGEAYNICSGRSVRVRRILELLLGLIERKVQVETDPERYRPEPEIQLRGDNGKLRAATGWRPQIELEQTVRDILQYWRGKTRRI